MDTLPQHSKRLGCHARSRAARGTRVRFLCETGAQEKNTMQINSVNNSSVPSFAGGDPFAKLKQSFEDIGTALDAGNISDAKDAFSKLQGSLPAQARNEKNPLSGKIEALSQALDSGDVKAAKDAFADIKSTAAKGPAGGAGRPQGPPPGGAPPGGGTPAAAGVGSSSNKIYDKEDVNKDGKVSFQEDQAYKLKHPESVTTTASTTTTAHVVKSDSDSRYIDTFA